MNIKILSKTPYDIYGEVGGKDRMKVEFKLAKASVLQEKEERKVSWPSYGMVTTDKAKEMAELIIKAVEEVEKIN